MRKRSMMLLQFVSGIAAVAVVAVLLVVHRQGGGQPYYYSNSIIHDEKTAEKDKEDEAIFLLRGLGGEGGRYDDSRHRRGKGAEHVGRNLSPLTRPRTQQLIFERHVDPLLDRNMTADPLPTSAPSESAVVEQEEETGDLYRHK
jgi:hypothetical protein